jgi:hypothetical protein
LEGRHKLILSKKRERKREKGGEERGRGERERGREGGYYTRRKIGNR